MDIQYKERGTTDKGTARRADDGSVQEGKTQDAPTTPTVVGPSIVIRGRLRCAEDLVIKGRVDAEITSTRSLHIENSGIVKANIGVQSVTINGVLVGNINAEQRTEIASDGRVVGDILTPKLVISDGASIRGRIDMPNFDAASNNLPAYTETKAKPSFAPPPSLPEGTDPGLPARAEVGLATPDEQLATAGDDTSKEGDGGLGGGLRRGIFDDKKGKKRRF